MPQNLEAILGQVKGIIIDCLELPIEPEEISDDELLLGGQLGLDSVTTLELTQMLEDEFAIEVADEDLSTELFESARSLSQYVERKLQENQQNVST